ncbi:MAG: aminotransferase class V-fold PLP-dependent enzyme, partial [Vicinamibacterales bacterium]
FEIAAGEVYLNGGANSPLPRAARAAIDEAWRLQATPSLIPFEAFFSYADAIRERAGEALGVPPSDLAVTTSTTAGMTLLAQGLRWNAGDRLLLGPDEFPSNAYPWFALEERGVIVQHIGVKGQPLTAADLTTALDAAGGPVRALSIAAVHYPTGDVHPLRAFADVLHARGAWLFTDASQAAGAVAIDWAASGVDAIAVSGYKWLFGPYGTGLLWVRPEVRDAVINVNGNWLAVEGARNLGQLMATYPRQYERHGRVFDAGEVASYFNLSAFRAGLDLLVDVRVPAVEVLHRQLQDRAVAGIAGLPLRSVTNLGAAHRSPMLMFEALDGLDLARLEADLAARRISVSLRMGRLRLSPGIWNDESDVDAFVEAVRHSVTE